MNTQVEKLTAALAAAKAMVNDLRAEKQTLKTKFKEELQAAKARKKPATRKAAVKKTPAKKAAPVKKSTSTAKSKKPVIASKVLNDERAMESIIEDTDLFPLAD